MVEAIVTIPFPKDLLTLCLPMLYVIEKVPAKNAEGAVIRMRFAQQVCFASEGGATSQCLAVLGRERSGLIIALIPTTLRAPGWFDGRVGKPDVSI